MAYTFDESIVSDLHKDARGCRPGETWWSMWNESSLDERQATWDGLIRELNWAMEEERAAEARAAADFEALIAKMGELGAADLNTAIRWIFESEGVDEHDAWHGSSYICWLFGLGYNHGLRPVFDSVLKEMFPVQKAA